jgi:hypothetical protein
MFASSRLRYALALVASAGLAGCSIYADGSDSSDTTGTDQVTQCVHDVIADCYLNQLPADVCADNVLTQCNLGGSDPNDPTCYDDVLRACLESGGDPMLCDLRAQESCGGGTGCDPNIDPTCTPGCQAGDPSCDPYGDCFTRTFDECMSMSGDPEQCRQYADQICGGGTPCDPMTDPNCTPTCVPGDPSCDPGTDCFDRVFADCLAQNNDPMRCIEVATQPCGGGGTPGCDPMTDPSCVPGCDPSTDPTCGGPSCYDQVFRDCLGQGLDPMTCDQEATAACGDPPPTGCDPNDPMCVPPPCGDPPPTGCDPNDPTCPPPPPPGGCDPHDPTCPRPPPPGGCDPNDPMCVPPPQCDPADPMCQYP